MAISNNAGAGMAQPGWRQRVEGLRAIADDADDFITLHDLAFRYVFVNRAFAQASGQPPEAYAGHTFLETGSSPRVADLLTAHLAQARDSGRPVTMEYETRLLAGTRVLQSRVNPVRGENEAVQGFLVITRDTTDDARIRAVRESQDQLMRLIVSGASLQQFMETLVRHAEENARGRLCSILLLAPDGRHLLCGHAPHLPAELIQAITQRPIGPDNACCGAAAYSKRLAVAADIAADPAWATHREVAVRHGLQACWSEPIVAADGELLGTFAMYHRRARAPYERELSLVREATLIAAVAIQSFRARESLLDAQERFRALTRNAANIVTVLDKRGTVLYVSPAIEPILGIEPVEHIGHPADERVHPDDLPAVQEAIRKLLSEIGSQTVMRYRFRHKEGSWRTLESIATSDLSRYGQPISVISTRDVTESERLTQVLREGEERLDRAIQASALGMWDWNIESGELYVDRHFAAMMGYPLEAMSSKIDWLLEHVHPDDVRRLIDVFSAHLKGLTPYCEGEFRGRMQSGAWKWLHVRSQVTQRRADGWALRMTGTNRDIEEQKRLESRLERAQTHIQLLLDATEEGIVGLDEVGTCTFINPAGLRMLGLTASQMLGQDFGDRVKHLRDGGEEQLGHDSPIHRCLTEGKRYRGGGEDVFTCGERAFPVEFSVSPIITGDEGGGAVVAFHDVSEKRALAQQLHYQALHDPLTGLMNRRGFEIRLNELLASARAENRRHALCYVDLDQFKVVNDTCGHVAGDELLRQLPDVLRPRVRERDTISRLGGDEFAILLEDCPLEVAGRIAEGLRDAVHAFRFVWEQRTFALGASLGVIGISADSQGPVSVLGAADAACYVAKEKGRNQVHVSLPNDLALIRRRGEMRWVARLRQAIEEDQFVFHYQSVAALDRPSEPPRSHELLLRLRDTKGGLIMPGAFLPAAERYQLITDIDRWVIDHAIAQLAALAASHPTLGEHRFGINLSGETLRGGAIVDHIEGALSRHGVSPALLYFEITETAAVANLGAAGDLMRRLKDLGCWLALDDFGSGMSSFAYLKHLPVDYLKIDGSFIRDIVNNPLDRSIVRAAQSIAHDMGIATVAEWVENQAILACLRDMGINYAQGYAIARPMPLEEIPGYLQPGVLSA